MGSRREMTEADRAIDRELGRLSSVDLEPLAARAQLVAAERRLAQRAARVSRLERCEPLLLCAVSAAHVAWALLRVLGNAGG